MVDYTNCFASISCNPMIKLFYLFCTEVYTGQNKETSNNACIQNENAKKTVYCQTDESAASFSKENEQDYDQTFFEKSENMNGMDVVWKKFAVEDEYKEIKSVIKRSTRLYAKNNSLKLQPLYIYTKIRNKLLYWSSATSEFTTIENVTTEENLGDIDCIGYQITKGENKQANEQEKAEKCRLKDSYYIRFATRIEESEENNVKKSYVRIYTTPCLRIYDQDIKLYRVDEFTDGFIGYYSSCLFKFTITDNYNTYQIKNNKNEFNTHSLEALRANLPDCKNYIDDVYTIEEDRKCKDFIMEFIRNISIMLWICEDNPFQHIQCVEKDIQNIKNIFEESKQRHYDEINAFFVIKEVMCAKKNFILGFLPDFIEECESQVTSGNCCTLGDQEKLQFCKFIDDSKLYLKIFWKSVLKSGTYSQLLSYKYWRKNILRKMLEGGKYTLVIANIVQTCIIKSSETMRQSYVFLAADQEDICKKFIERFCKGSSYFENTAYQEFESVLNDFSETSNLGLCRLLRNHQHDEKHTKKFENEYKIFVDIDKRLRIADLMTKVICDNKDVINVKSMNDLTDIFLKNINKEPYKQNKDIKNGFSDQFTYVSYMHIFFSVLKTDIYGRVDKRDVVIRKKNVLFDILNAKNYNDIEKFTTGNGYHRELLKRYNGLYEFLKKTYGTYVARILITQYEKCGKLYLSSFLYRHHLLGDFTADK